MTKELSLKLIDKRSFEFLDKEGKERGRCNVKGYEIVGWGGKGIEILEYIGAKGFALEKNLRIASDYQNSLNKENIKKAERLFNIKRGKYFIIPYKSKSIGDEGKN